MRTQSSNEQATNSQNSTKQTVFVLSYGKVRGAFGYRCIIILPNAVVIKSVIQQLETMLPAMCG